MLLVLRKVDQGPNYGLMKPRLPNMKQWSASPSKLQA